MLLSKVIKTLGVVCPGCFLLCRKEGETMTDKQKRFCDEYLIDCNATRAYKAAYPTVKGDTVASANASRLLGNANIKAYIDEKMQEISSNKVATAEEVIEYLTSVLRGESSSEVVVVEGSGMGVSEARRIEKAPDEKERLKAAELLGKRYGLFTDKVNIEGSLPVMIVGEDSLEE
jgi:phage terminase small subunit